MSIRLEKLFYLKLKIFKAGEEEESICAELSDSMSN